MDQHKDCPNCGATVSTALIQCDRCAFDFQKSSGEIVKFSIEAKDQGELLGGILTLTKVNGKVVKLVARCPAGAFGINKTGQLIWQEDWSYLSSFEYAPEKNKLFLNKKEVDLESGKIL